MTSTAVGRIRWATLLPAWLAVAALLASPGIAQKAVRFAVIGDSGHQVQYVTSGASARLRADVIDHGNTFTAKAVGTIHSFLIACATREAIALEAIGADGKTLDSFTVVKRQSTEPGRTGR
jgi:hypothetical protein